jgi:hypothetical protein
MVRHVGRRATVLTAVGSAALAIAIAGCGSSSGSSPTTTATSSPAKVGPAQTFSGTGDKLLGTLSLKRTVVIHWTVSGQRFSLTDKSQKLKISGAGKTGQSFAAEGTYRSVRVNASGHWTVTIASLGA